MCPRQYSGKYPRLSRGRPGFDSPPGRIFLPPQQCTLHISYISIISPSVSRHNYTIHDSDVKRIRILWFLVSVLCAFLFVLVGWCESKGKFLFSLPYSAFELKTFRTTKTVHRPGIEPGSPAWQASILPLDHRCFPLRLQLHHQIHS